MDKKGLKEYDPNVLKDEIREYWKTNNIPSKVKEAKRGGKNYYIVREPENVRFDASLTDLYKTLLYDIWSKYQWMNNYNVNIRHGFNVFSNDCQKQLLQKLDLKDIEQLKNMENEELRRTWKEVSNECLNRFEDFFKGIRVWEGSSKKYLVSDKEFINSIWWTIGELYNKDLVRKRERDIWRCKNCDREYSQKNIQEEVFVDSEYLLKIPVKRGKNRFLFLKMSNLLSLLAPAGLIVSTEGKYSVINYELEGLEEKGIVSKSKVDDIMEEAGINNYKEINIIPGNKIHNMEFENPINKLMKHRKKIKKQMTTKIIASDNTEFEDDMRLVTPGITEDSSKFFDEIGVEVTYNVDEEEKIGKNIKYKGVEDGLIRNLYKKIEKDLKRQRSLLNVQSEERIVTSCPKCSKELESNKIEEWSLITEGMEEQIERISENTDWVPEWASPLEDYGSLKDIDNWKVSSEKGIGIQLPIWICECGSSTIISSIDELEKFETVNMNTLIFPHNLEQLDIECEECGEKMTWDGKKIHPNFIKSVSPWAQLGYPDNERDFQSWWPGDISYGKFMDDDGVIFGNLVLSNILFDGSSIKTIATVGQVEGNIDFSKFIGNIDYDSLRLTLLKNSPPWEDREIKKEDLKKPNKSIKVLWNIFNFYKELKKDLRSNDELKNESLESFYENTQIEDRWILSKLQDVIVDSENCFETFRFDELISILEEFILNDIGQWYIGIVRERIREGDEIDKISVFFTLDHLLKSTTAILSPLSPHISEKIFCDLNPNVDTVFNSDRNVEIDQFRNEEIHRWKSLVDEIVSDVFKLKKDMELPLKWPFQEIVIDVSNKESFDYFEEFKHILKNKAKIKEISVIDPDEEWKDLVLTVEANRNAIGKTYRQWASRIALLLENRDAEEMKDKIEKGDYIIGIEGHQTEIQPEMVTFKKELPEGYIEIEYDDFSVYINYEMSDEIWDEQIAKEIKLRIKSMREEFDLFKKDEVEIFIYPPEEFLGAIKTYDDEILSYVGGKSITILDDEIEEAEYVLEWDINGELVDIGINPLYKTNILQIYQSIPGMSHELAERLYEEGYTSLDKIKQASAGDISNIRGFKRSLARRIVQTMKEKGEKLKTGEIEEKELKSGVDKERKRFRRDLQRISGIGKSTSEKITEKGYNSFEDIAEASVEQLMEISYMKEETALRLIDYAKKKHTPDIKKKDMEKKEPKDSFKKEEKEPEEDEFGIEEGIETEETAKELPEGIQKSSTYMIKNKDNDEDYTLFKDILDTGMDGMCITREYPKKIENKYGLEDVSIVWLSNVDRKNAVRPKNLEKLSLKLEKFLTARNGVILLSGVEYLITNNEFKTVLHLLQSLKDQVAITESILLIPISSKALDDYQLDLLESEMDKIIN